MQPKQTGPVVINGSVHTARKQHQRKNVLICVRNNVLCVLCELSLGRAAQRGTIGPKWVTLSLSLSVCVVSSRTTPRPPLRVAWQAWTWPWRWHTSLVSLTCIWTCEIQIWSKSNCNCSAAQKGKIKYHLKFLGNFQKKKCAPSPCVQSY